MKLMAQGARSRLHAEDEGMDDELTRLIRARAYELWEADGRPEGKEMEYWLRAEEELTPQSIAGEEDPLEALDHELPGTAGEDQAS
jgi:hypothetical protein